MGRLRLLCDSNPMAYGSSASLAAILAALPVDAEITAIGRDASLEFLQRAIPSGRIVERNVKDPEDVGAFVEIERPDAALVVSNLSNIRTYVERGVPVFFVDILFWYGQRKDEATWATFERGFALDFPGVGGRVASLAWTRPPTVVGPLLRALPPRTKEPRGTLVGLGGVRSPYMSPARARAGLEIVAHVLRTIAPALPPGEVTIATGADAASMLRSLLPASMRVGPLAPSTYDACLQSSALFLTVPGLNGILEAMAAEVPLAVLPALNASQCLQLRHYQEAGVCSRGFELDRFVDLELPERVTDERTLTDSVVDALECVASRPAHLDEMANAVATQLPVSPNLTRRRRAFVDALGPPGASIIARSIANWWQERGT